MIYNERRESPFWGYGITEDGDSFIVNYCCPIKLQYSNKVWLERLIFSVRVFFFILQAPLIKKRWFGWCTGSHGKDLFPVLFGIVEETVEVKVIH